MSEGYIKLPKTIFDDPVWEIMSCRMNPITTLFWLLSKCDGEYMYTVSERQINTHSVSTLVEEGFIDIYKYRIKGFATIVIRESEYYEGGTKAIPSMQTYAKYYSSHNRKEYGYQKFRADVLKRDNYTCQFCGSKERLEVHHIKPYAKYPALRTTVRMALHIATTAIKNNIKKGVWRMAIYRTLQVSFWTDSKVVDDFTPEDKYFYLYLFTNPQTNLCGCYEVSLTTMSNQTGYNKETVQRLLERFENVHKVIRYSSKTKEILILNWHKYNWTLSPKFLKGLSEQIQYVKNPDFKAYLTALMSGDNTVSIPYEYHMDTSVTNTVHKNNKNNKDLLDSIVTSFNETCVSLPKVTKLSDKRKKKLELRLKDFSAEDLKAAFEKVEASDFTSGRNGKWNATFDWILEEGNLIKVLEGNYDNKKGDSNGQRTDTKDDVGDSSQYACRYNLYG